ncbi:uncharacterized protein L199_004155 [Kwoniella botswanensis]|uniref:uncharacterized protein n=1 Tax=Kwoniella botswanensis TaxID=1268659 RepID=UPI00315CE02A
MSLQSFQEFLDGIDDTLDPLPSPPTPPLRPRKPSPKFPEDVLSTIFDIFTSINFPNLKIAVRVNTFLYNRYQPKLYRYISLNSNNVGDFQLHATLILAASDTGLPPRRNRDRFLNLCHSITHLEIDDEEAKNLRAYDKKNPKSPEIWKLEILKSHWNLHSMTFHNDVGSTRIIFTGVPLQRFFMAHLAGRSPSVLMPSTEDNIGNDQTRVQIYQDSPNHTVGMSVDLQRRIRGQDVTVFGDQSMGECVCCSSSRRISEDVISIRW